MSGQFAKSFEAYDSTELRGGAVTGGDFKAVFTDERDLTLDARVRKTWFATKKQYAKGRAIGPVAAPTS